MKNVMILSLCLVSVSAFAKPGYLAKFKAAYPAATAIAKCTVCHVGTGYKESNDFAKDYAANAYDYKAIEGFDSDVDGVKNLDEITAGTLPGSADSHPVAE
jgi:cytochrome c553